jgi:hypothetical protein
MCVQPNHVFSNVLWYTESSPAEGEDVFGNSIEGPFDVPAREVMVGFAFFRLFHDVSEL